jgi:hypothetical protein
MLLWEAIAGKPKASNSWPHLEDRDELAGEGMRAKAFCGAETDKAFDCPRASGVGFETQMHQLFTNPASASNMAMCCCMCMCTRERPVLSNFS